MFTLFFIVALQFFMKLLDKDFNKKMLYNKQAGTLANCLNKFKTISLLNTKFQKMKSIFIHNVQNIRQS